MLIGAPDQSVENAAMELLFVWISVATLVFLLNQLYAGLRSGELHVRSGIYSRQRTPVLYWAAIFTVISGITFLLFFIASCASIFFW